MAREKIKRIITIPAQNIKLNTIEERIKKEGGKRVLKDDKHLELRFGNNLLIRLFGTGIIHNFLKKPLPAKLSISLKEDILEIKMEDNLGWYLMIDPICIGSYNKFYNYLEKILTE